MYAITDAYGGDVQMIDRTSVREHHAAAELLSDVRQGQMVLADRAYDADWLRDLVAEKGGWANIPPKRNRRSPICFTPSSQ